MDINNNIQMRNITHIASLVIVLCLGVTWSEAEDEDGRRRVIPRSIVDNGTLLDTTVVVNEGTRVQLTCLSSVSGQPPATITWEKEDGTNFVVFDSRIEKEKSVRRFVRQELILPNVTRTETGAYLCTASNKRNEIVSKRIQLQVNFSPTIKVKWPRIRVTEGDPVRMECTVEASPKATNYWVKGSDEMMITRTDPRISTILEDFSEYSVRMSLSITNVSPSDYSVYRCISKNSMGAAKGFIELFAPENHSDELYHSSGDGDDDEEEEEEEDVSKSREDHSNHDHDHEMSTELFNETTMPMDTTTHPQMTTSTIKTMTDSSDSSDGISLHSCSAVSIILAMILITFSHRL